MQKFLMRSTEKWTVNVRYISAPPLAGGNVKDMSQEGSAGTPSLHGSPLVG